MIFRKIKKLIKSECTRILSSSPNNAEILITGLHEKIQEEVDKKFNALTDNLISEVNDLKSDYLKRYLEVRMNANDAFLTHLTTKLDVLEQEVSSVKHALLDYDK